MFPGVQLYVYWDIKLLADSYNQDLTFSRLALVEFEPFGM